MQKNMQLNMPSISQMQAIAKKMAGISTSDLKFFTTTKKGEIHELREELNQQSRDKKKDAVKKVIANMTVGKDVSMLFTDVVNCIQTADTQLKKLVYLYLINYAKSHPDLAILAVNTFVKDANDPNPLIRALSIRTMGCIRVDRIAEYLCEPLRRCLQDDDPYVRKTAAICVAKLYDINAQLVEEQGFLDSLQELISDSNPTVVANAVAALSEISDTSKKNLFDISKSILQKLLAALNECTEWGQVLILDALAKYTPSDDREAENIIERITPRLQHANSAVVLSAVKVIMGLLDRLTNNDTIRNVTRKLAPPLVTLLSTEPEIQYVALRNINLIVQKRPAILSNEIKVFFCKYNDPIYVKMEKLEIIIKLVADRNIEQVLLELKEYATEVDVDFVRKSVRAIGRCAIKLDIATERCINLLLELIQTKVNYIVQEAIIVIKDIFRKYPNQYESIIATLCDNLETLDEPEAKASMVWIIGEYAERIDNADELLKGFLDGFDDETSQVQLQLLTATVKLFLKRPQDTQDLVQKVLNLATENSDNPDLRDRGYVYWRLLSSSPEAARAVVWATKPTISDDTFSFDSKLLDKLLGQIATLSSVYHKLPDTFVSNVSMKEAKELDDLNKEDVAGPIDSNEEDSISTKDEAKAPTNAKTGSAEIDLLNMGGDAPVQPSNQPSTVATSLVDIFGSPSPPAPSVLPETANNKVLTSQKGLVIKGGLNQKSSQLILNLMIENQTSVPLTGFAIQLNKSTFGLAPEKTQFMFDAPIKPGGTASTPVNLRVDPAFVNVTAPPASSLQAALKNMANGDVIYFNIDYDLDILYGSNSNVDKNEFVTLWKSLPENPNAYSRVDRISKDLDALSGSLEKYRVYYIAKRVNSGAQPSVVAYFSAKTLNNAVALFELSFEGNNFKTCRVGVKTDHDIYLPLFQKSIESLLQK